MAHGWLYDGESAVRRSVSVEPGLDGVRILPGGDDSALAVAAGDLFHLESRADAELYGRSGIPGWRLAVAKPLPPELAAAFPARRIYGRWVDRVGLPRALAIGAVLSAALLFVGYSAPAWIAPLVPYSWEQRFGNALVGDFGGNVCAGEGGQAALDALAAKLGATPSRFEVRVVDVPIVNAVALPGGHILIFDGLLQEAAGPDEVAGVLGHEIAHVTNRDVAEAMIRHYGFSLLLSTFGGTTGGNVDWLASTSYSREAESQADADSLRALARADISPLPTAAFFGRLAGQEAGLGRLKDALSYVSSHPLSAERRRRFADSARPGHAYRPALTAGQWQALRTICEAG